jgi:hypothetical protein
MRKRKLQIGLALVIIPLIITSLLHLRLDMDSCENTVYYIAWAVIPCIVSGIVAIDVFKSV